MFKFLSIDSKFTAVMTKLADFGLITIFTVICSLPLLTIGPALTAFFYIGLKLVRDEEGYIFKGYFKAFKDNFVQSFLAEVVILVVGSLMGSLMAVVVNWTQQDHLSFLKFVWFLQIGVCVVLVAGVIYLFPLISRFKNNLPSQIKNSILMAVKHVPQTILMLIVDCLLIFYTLDYPFLWIFDVGIIGFANSMVLASIFRLYMPKENAEEDELEAEAVVEDTASDDSNNEE